MPRLILVAQLLLVAAAIAGPRVANAALVTLCGPTVCYEYDDDAGVNAGIVSFGTPSLLGNSDYLQFTPTSLVAVESNGGSVSVTSTFLFNRVWAAPGFEIDVIAVQEFGDYRIVNGGSVLADLQLQVVDLVNDGATSAFPEAAVGGATFTSSVPTGFGLTNWGLFAFVTPASVFTDLATVVGLQITDTLAASTNGPGQQAFIQKKLRLVVGTEQTVVPVPAAAWLLISGLGLLGGLRRVRAA